MLYEVRCQVDAEYLLIHYFYFQKLALQNKLRNKVKLGVETPIINNGSYSYLDEWKSKGHK